MGCLRPLGWSCWALTGSCAIALSGEGVFLFRRPRSGTDGAALLIRRMYTSTGLGWPPQLATVLDFDGVSITVVALYALQVVADSPSSSEPSCISARADSSIEAVPRLLQVLLTVTFLISGKLSSCEWWLCWLLQLVMVVLLLLLSKPDSMSLFKCEASEVWRLKLLWDTRAASTGAVSR